jgi:NTE family protein
MFSLRTALLPLPLALAFFLAGCAGQRPVATTSDPSVVMGPPLPETQVDSQDVPGEVYGPKLPSTETASSASTSASVSTAVSTDTSTMVGPPSPGALATDTATGTATTIVAPSSDSAKLCLVLGPGMAKAMAEAAVLEAIRKAKLPVHCVVGTEMGAIVGALYSYANGNTNNVQWQLFKLNKDNYFAFPMLSLREPRSTGHKLNEFLRGLFHDSRIERLPIRFGTTAVDDDGDNTVELGQGTLADALSASVAMPGIFDSWKVGDHSFRSAASAEPAPMELARKLGGNFLVLVDVLVDGGAPAKSRYHRAFTASRSVLKLEKKEAQYVINVNTGAIAFDDFNRKADILSAGASAAEKAMPELKAAWDKWSAGQH